MTTPGTEQRRLAAIMFTDMVGYSALAQRNEALALDLLEEHRSLLRSHFPGHNGTEIKTIGDAFLVEFSSALEAARCAIEIQRALAHRNTDAPADRRIQIRIGIHIGDVVHREGDVYGDGVNIASRIEPLAGPCGICISMDVERQIRHALEASLVRLPPAALKNIQVPMELFRIELPWEKEAQKAQRSATRGSRKSAALAAVAIIVVPGLFLCGWLSQRSSKGRPPALPQANIVVAAASNAPTSAPDQHSLAVLPFVNTSSDKENEYLSDGITDELINTLQPLHGLQVKGRASSFYFKGKNERLQKIGQDLQVKYLVEGTVSKAGNKLRITVDLVTAADESQLWAMKYDRPLDDLLAIRTDVATSVAEALKGHLPGEERQQLARRGTDNAEAHRLYLQGRQLWNRRTGDSVKQAVNYFNQAIAKDPGYALAYAGLADCYDVLPTYTTLPPRETFSKARTAALKALELDSTLVEPRAVLADLKGWLDWNWSGAEEEFREALAVNPSSATAHHWFAELLVCLGRYPEALVQGTRAQEIDPLSPIINARLGHTLALAGKADLGIALLQRQIALDPAFGAAHKFLGRIYFDQANWAGAISELELTSQLDVGGIYGLGLLGAAYVRSGRTNEAQKILGHMVELQRLARADCRLGIAAVQHALSDDDAALDWLEKALTQHSFGLEELNSSSFWKDLRPHPRLQAILKKMNLEK